MMAKITCYLFLILAAFTLIRVLRLIHNLIVCKSLINSQINKIVKTSFKHLPVRSVYFRVFQHLVEYPTIWVQLINSTNFYSLYFMIMLWIFFTKLSQVVASSSSIKRVYFCMWILNCIKLLKALKSVFKPPDFLDW